MEELLERVRLLDGKVQALLRPLPDEQRRSFLQDSQQVSQQVRDVQAGVLEDPDPDREAYLSEVYEAVGTKTPGSSVAFLPAGTGMERVLLAAARQALQGSSSSGGGSSRKAGKVVFVGDSLEFLCDLFTRASTVLGVKCCRCSSDTRRERFASLVAQHDVLFVSYGVALSMLARGALQPSGLALVVLDNVFDAEELANSLRGGAGGGADAGAGCSSHHAPKVLAVVPPLFSNGLEDVVDISTDLQTCVRALGAAVVAPSQQLRPLERLLHGAGPSFATVPATLASVSPCHSPATSPKPQHRLQQQLQLCLAQHCDVLWQQMVSSTGEQQVLAFGAGVEPGELLFEPDRLAGLWALLQRSGSSSHQEEEAQCQGGAGGQGDGQGAVGGFGAQQQQHGGGNSGGDALAEAQSLVMEHVKDCLQAHRLCVDVGPGACLAAFSGALQRLVARCSGASPAAAHEPLLTELRSRLDDPLWASLAGLTDIEEEAEEGGGEPPVVEAVVEAAGGGDAGGDAAADTAAAAAAGASAGLQCARFVKLRQMLCAAAEARRSSGGDTGDEEEAGSDPLALVVAEEPTRTWLQQQLELGEQPFRVMCSPCGPRAGTTTTTIATEEKQPTGEGEADQRQRREKQKDAAASGTSAVLLLTSRQLAALPVPAQQPPQQQGVRATGPSSCCPSIRYSQAPTSQVLVDARAAAGAGYGPLVALTSRPGHQRAEMQRMVAVESRLKAAVQMVSCGGHGFFHALLQLGDSESHREVEPYAATALQLYCLHKYGEVPKYILRSPSEEPTAAAAPSASASASGGAAAKKEEAGEQARTSLQNHEQPGSSNNGGGGGGGGGGGTGKPPASALPARRRTYSCGVQLPCPPASSSSSKTGPDGGPQQPLVLESGDCSSERAARCLAAFAACRYLFDEGGFARYFGLNPIASDEDDEDEDEADVVLRLAAQPLPPSVGRTGELPDPSYLDDEAGEQESAGGIERAASGAACENDNDNGDDDDDDADGPLGQLAALLAREAFGFQSSSTSNPRIPSRQPSLVRALSSGDSMLYTPFVSAPTPAGLARTCSGAGSGGLMRPPKRPELVCKVCGVRATNSWNFESHLLGRKHTRRLAALRLAKDAAAGSGSERGSGSGGSLPGSPGGGMLHMEGLHTRVMDNPVVPLVTIEKGSRRIFMCPICGVSATSARNYLAHIQGKSHLKKVRRAGEAAQGGNADAASSSSATPLTSEVQAEHRQGGGQAEVDINRQLEEVGRVLQELGHTMPDLPEMPYKCEVCGIYTTSEQLMEGHLAGRKHLKRLQALHQEAEQRGEAMPEGMMAMPLTAPRGAMETPYYCEVCGIYATSEQQLDMHYAGRRHQQAAQGKRRTRRRGRAEGPDGMLGPPGSDSAGGMAGAGGVGGGIGNTRTEFKCELCGVTSPNLQQLEYHYSGQKHQRRLRQHQKLLGFSPGFGGMPPAAALAAYAAGSCDVRELTMRRASATDLLQGVVGGSGMQRRAAGQSRDTGETDDSAGGGGGGGGGTFIPGVVVRQASGNIYDNFPCVRVGEYVLPSSMDLRAYLEEVQVGAGKDSTDGSSSDEEGGGAAAAAAIAAANSGALGQHLAGRAAGDGGGGQQQQQQQQRTPGGSPAKSLPQRVLGPGGYIGGRGGPGGTAPAARGSPLRPGGPHGGGRNHRQQQQGDGGGHLGGARNYDGGVGPHGGGWRGGGGRGYSGRSTPQQQQQQDGWASPHLDPQLAVRQQQQQVGVLDGGAAAAVVQQQQALGMAAAASAMAAAASAMVPITQQQYMAAAAGGYFPAPHFYHQPASVQQQLHHHPHHQFVPAGHWQFVPPPGQDFTGKPFASPLAHALPAMQSLQAQFAAGGMQLPHDTAAMAYDAHHRHAISAGIISQEALLAAAAASQQQARHQQQQQHNNNRG